MPFQKSNFPFKNQINNTYLIIGGGPSAIMCAYQLHLKYPNSIITILEQNNYTYQDYLSNGYDKLDKWSQAFGDGNYNQTFPTIDTPPENALVGKGLGGGTLHFGLQYINTDMVIDQNYSEWKDIFTKITKLLQLKRYQYPPQKLTNGLTTQQIQLRNTLSNSKKFKTFNNLIYSDNIDINSKYLLPNLIKDIKNINVKYGVKINTLVKESNKIISIIDSNNKTYTADYYILAAGTLNTCLLLQKIGLNAGNDIYDHAGVSITYLPPKILKKSLLF